MKINVLRALVLPWFLFFIFLITGIVVAGVEFNLQALNHEYFSFLLLIGTMLCLFANIQALSKAGIWITHSLPSALRYHPWSWISRAVKAALVAGAFYLFGQLAWIPLIWQGAVIPVVFTICLFIIVWSLVGPLLNWSSRINFSRFFAFVFSLPIFALVPLSALFLGQSILTAYEASQPRSTVALLPPPQTSNKLAKDTESTSAEPEVGVTHDKSAQAFREMALAGKSCAENAKDILMGVNPYGPEEKVYWAVKAVKCAELKSVVALPKLVKVMIEHPSPRVRAAAILAMTKYRNEDVQRVGYLLVKRISEKEATEVIEAAASLLSRLGEDERKWSMNRLKVLLENPKTSSSAAKILIKSLNREDLVAEYVTENLGRSGAAQERAIAMICALPKTSRSIAEPHINAILSTIKTGAKNDPAVEALTCIGDVGLMAIRREVIAPRLLSRQIAARTLAEMDFKSAPQELLETAKNCVRDKDGEVRKWCSQSLGKMGVQALPQILDLLKSNNSDLKEAGTAALDVFDDPNAKLELAKIRADNSGWMANKRKLQIAQAVDNALNKIAIEESPTKTE